MWLYDLAALDLAYGEFENNLDHNITQRSINIKDAQTEKRAAEAKQELENLPEKTGCSDVEPDYIPEVKKKESTAKPKPKLL